jgi:hypothetical protein
MIHQAREPWGTEASTPESRLDLVSSSLTYFFNQYDFAAECEGKYDYNRDKIYTFSTF